MTFEWLFKKIFFSRDKVIMNNFNATPFALPDIGTEEIDEVVDTLKSGWLTTGPKVKKFENDFKDYLNVKYAFAVNSCTSGLHLALEACGVGPGDEVVVPVHTFTATAEVVRYLGAETVFADINRETLNIDENEIKPKLNGRVKAIIPVHFAGQACNIGAISEMAESHDLSIIEDAAHAIPCTYQGKTIGTISDATVFSFYTTKPIATGEGGMIATNSKRIAERVNIMRLHGIDRDIWERYTEIKPNWKYAVVAPGFKYNMPDIMAAIGIHQLKKADAFQQRRKWIASQYNKAFKRMPIGIPCVQNELETHAWHLYVVQLEIEALAITRDEFINKMSDMGIGTSVHFRPLHLHPYWRDRYNLKPEDFPVAYDIYNRSVSLPIYSKMTDDDVCRVIEAVKTALS